MKLVMKFLVLFFFVLIFNFNLVLAEDLDAGQVIFSANCAACHAGGNNAIMPEKTLKKDVLELNGMNSAEAIINQVTNGKSAMPAFGGRLSDDDIVNVAGFVLNQASTDSW